MCEVNGFRLQASQEDTVALYKPGLEDQLSSGDSESFLMLRESLAADLEEMPPQSAQDCTNPGRVQLQAGKSFLSGLPLSLTCYPW